MSQKDLCIQLLDSVPEYKLGYVLAYLQGITADEREDDEFCIKLLEDYQNSNDDEKDVLYTLDDCKREWGLIWCKIIIKKPAKKFIDKLPINEKKLLVAAIEGLPYNGDIKRLQGYDGYYRLRVGSYRIIFYVDNGELIVYVVDIGNRGQIYNRY